MLPGGLCAAVVYKSIVGSMVAGSPVALQKRVHRAEEVNSSHEKPVGEMVHSLLNLVYK